LHRLDDVDLLARLAEDLAEWRLVCGRPVTNQLIIPTVDARGREAG
jgi:hypothetical protein